MIKEKRFGEKVLVAPFRSRNTTTNVSTNVSSFLPPSSFLFLGDRSDSKKPRTREPTEQHSNQSAISRLPDLRLDGQVAASREKGYPRREGGRRGEGGRGARVVVFRRMRCLFRTEIGTTRSLRHSQCLERRGGIEERTRPSSSSSDSSTSSSSNSSSRIRPSRRGRRTRIGQRDGEEREKKRSDQAVS